MYGRNATHHACSSRAGPDSPAVKWQFTLGTREGMTQPAYDADGVVYFGAQASA
jgi:hypothetical protein